MMLNDTILQTEELMKRFSWPDYLVFAAMLVGSLAIGIYYGFTGPKKATTAEFFMGGRHMGVFPVAMSLAASFYSATGIMGLIAEVYRFGIMQSMLSVGFLFIGPTVAYLYAPVFHRLQVSSSFEYLERRFHVAVRKVASALLIIQMLLYMATSVWSPALALSQVTGMNAYIAVTANLIVCAIYTAIGGFKAVLWTDTLQLILMLVTMFTVFFKGNNDVGGFAAVINASTASGRIEFFEFNPDPTIRHSIWSLVIGGYFTWMATFAVNQAQVQRYMSLPSLKDIRKALLLCFVLYVSLLVLVYYSGLIIYTRYKDCDPLSTGLVSKADQLLPLFVLDTMGAYKGLPGLMVAGLYSAALSTVSSGLNSLAAITLEDFIRPVFSSMTETRAIIVSKSLSFLFGLLAFGVVFLIANSANLVEAVLAIFGLGGGPLLGVFTLGMFFPWANSWGAFCGFVSSTIIMFWIGFGAMIAKSQGLLRSIAKPISVSGCPVMNKELGADFPTNSTTAELDASSTPTELTSVLAVYELSYMWYSACGFLLVIIIGLIVSGLRGFRDPKSLDPQLIVNVGDTLFWYAPKKIRKFLRFHVGDNHQVKRSVNETEQLPLTAGSAPS